MKAVGSILGIRHPDHPQEVIERLIEAYPEGKRPFSFDCILPIDDPRFVQVQTILNELGLEPWLGFETRLPHQYWYKIVREYTTADLRAFKYLIPKPNSSLGTDIVPLGRRKVKLDLSKCRSKREVGFSNYAHVIISEALKRHLETFDLGHILFRPTEWEGGKTTAQDIVYWELASDFVLPPMAPSTMLVGGDGEPFDGDYDHGCYLFEPYCNPQEPHYTASSLRNIEPFDLAMSVERFGIKESGACPKTIVSRRFFEICVERKLTMNWVPVHVDPD